MEVISAAAAVAAAWYLYRNNRMQSLSSRPYFTFKNKEHIGGDWYRFYFIFYSGDYPVAIRWIKSNALILADEKTQDRQRVHGYDALPETGGNSVSVDWRLPSKRETASGELSFLLKLNKSESVLRISLCSKKSLFAVRHKITHITMTDTD